MKFCSHCENMLYTKLAGEKEDELMYYCRNCNIVEPCDVNDLCVSKINFKRSEQKYQNSVNVKTKKKIKLQVGGRHDPCVVPRAPPVVDSLVSLVLADHALLGGFIKPVL